MKRFGLRWAVPVVPALLHSTAFAAITQTASLWQVITPDIIKAIWKMTKSSLVPQQEKNRKGTVSMCDGKQQLARELLT